MRQGSATTTSTYTYEGLTLLSLDATSEEGTAAASWRIDYLADSTGRPYGGIYTSSETSAVAFGIITTDRGDVRELTDGAGTPFARYDHDAYGNPTRTLSAATPGLDAATAAAIAGRNILRYAGYAFDQHSGLYYLSQRYYDPATCQFITKDPAKADGEESAYQYCGGDPVGKVDPSGEAALLAPAVTAGVIVLLAAAVGTIWWGTLPRAQRDQIARALQDALGRVKGFAYNEYAIKRVGLATMTLTLRRNYIEQVWYSPKGQRPPIVPVAENHKRVMVIARVNGIRYMTVLSLSNRAVWNCIPYVTDSYINNTKWNYHYSVRVWPWPKYFKEYA